MGRVHRRGLGTSARLVRTWGLATLVCRRRSPTSALARLRHYGQAHGSFVSWWGGGLGECEVLRGGVGGGARRERWEGRSHVLTIGGERRPHYFAGCLTLFFMNRWFCPSCSLCCFSPDSTLGVWGGWCVFGCLCVCVALCAYMCMYMYACIWTRSLVARPLCMCVSPLGRPGFIYHSPSAVVQPASRKCPVQVNSA